MKYTEIDEEQKKWIDFLGISDNMNSDTKNVFANDGKEQQKE